MLIKLGNILLTFLVVCTTTGTIINQHYSEGELYSSSFFLSPDSCCTNSQEKTEHKDSCHEVLNYYKVEDFFRTSDQLIIHAPFTFLEQANHLTVFHFKLNLLVRPIFIETQINSSVINTSEFLQVFRL
ncbi:MAG: HYC_CC_PP family protein [Bacteroidales bacterium]